jgi:hypothetical protein
LVEERSGDRLTAGVSLVDYICGLPLSISFVYPKEKEEETH